MNTPEVSFPETNPQINIGYANTGFDGGKAMATGADIRGENIKHFTLNKDLGFERLSNRNQLAVIETYTASESDFQLFVYTIFLIIE